MPQDSSPPLSPTASVVPTRHGFWFRRRSVPCPTWRLWLCSILTLALLIVLTARHLHAWLSLTDPVPDARYLVVEGWVPDHVVSAAVTLAEETDATRLFCTGVPLDHGSFLEKYKTTADVASLTAARLGLDPARICPAPCADVKTERTRAMALALKAVLELEPVPDTGRRFNIVTQGTHARRSLSVFREVFGPEWRIGVVSIPPVSYDPAIWFRQSEGAKNVINELAALGMNALGAN